MWWKLAAAHRLAGGRLHAPVAVYRRHRGNRSRARSSQQLRLDVTERTWEWARARADIPHQRAWLRLAFARALANCEASPVAAITRRAAAYPPLLFWPELWVGLAKRLARAARDRLRSALRRDSWQ